MLQELQTSSIQDLPGAKLTLTAGAVAYARDKTERMTVAILTRE